MPDAEAANQREFFHVVDLNLSSRMLPSVIGGPCGCLVIPARTR
jgi:hypothetical protein